MSLQGQTPLVVPTCVCVLCVHVFFVYVFCLCLCVFVYILYMCVHVCGVYMHVHAYLYCYVDTVLYMGRVVTWFKTHAVCKSHINYTIAYPKPQNKINVYC